MLQGEYPNVLTDQLGRVTIYKAPRMRFHSQVSSDGGRQVDFSRGAKPIIQKQVQEWMSMGVIKSMQWHSACVSPLLLISNKKKLGLKVCHDLRMLNSVKVKE